MWDIASSRQVRFFKGHWESVDPVDVSPDGRYVVSGAGDAWVKLYDMQTGKEIRAFIDKSISKDRKEGIAHKGWVDGVAFSPDGQCVLSGATDGLAKLWETSTGRLVRVFRGYAHKIRAVSYSPDGKKLLVGGYSHSGLSLGDDKDTLRLWDLSKGETIQVFTGHRGVMAAALSHDGKKAISGDTYGTLKLWDLATGKEIQEIKAFNDSVKYVAFYPDDKKVLSLEEDALGQDIKLWDLETGKEIEEFRKKFMKKGKRWYESIDLSADGRLIVGANHEEMILSLFDSTTGKRIRKFKNGKRETQAASVAISPDGSLVASGWTRNAAPAYGDAPLTLWETRKGKRQRLFSEDIHRPFYSKLLFSPDGRRLVSSDRRNITVWDVSSGSKVKIFKGHKDYIQSLVFSPDGTRVVSGSDDRTVVIWDFATGKKLATLIALEKGEWVIVTPQGYYNASANGAKYLNVRIGKRVYSMDQFNARFYRPELVQLALQGKELPDVEPIEKIAVAAPAPSVDILSPGPGRQVKTDFVRLSVRITDNGGGIGDVSVYVNGAQVANQARGTAVVGKQSWYQYLQEQVHLAEVLGPGR